MFPNLNSLIAKTTTLIDTLAYFGLQAGVTGSSNQGLYHDFYPHLCQKTYKAHNTGFQTIVLSIPPPPPSYALPGPAGLFLPPILYYRKQIISSRGGLGGKATTMLKNSCLFPLPVVQIWLGDVYMVQILTKKELWTRFRHPLNCENTTKRN